MKSYKAPDLFRKTYFQIKVDKSGRCHNLGPERIPGGIFAATAHDGARFFTLFPYFSYINHFTKFTRGSSLILKRFLLLEKSKAERSPWLKKKKYNDNDKNNNNKKQQI